MYARLNRPTLHNKGFVYYIILMYLDIIWYPFNIGSFIAVWEMYDDIHTRTQDVIKTTVVLVYIMQSNMSAVLSCCDLSCILDMSRILLLTIICEKHVMCVSDDEKDV